MSYDVTSPRYSHLKGLTPEQIERVMAITDGAMEQARRELEKEDQRTPEMLIQTENRRSREDRRERREFQCRVICFCTGFFAGILLSIIALTPMIRK